MTLAMTLALPLGLACVAYALFAVVYGFTCLAPLPPPSGGRRALARRQALANHAWLRLLDHSLRRLAALVEPHIPARLGERLAGWLRASGHPMGLTATEFLLLSLMSALFAAPIGWLYGATLVATPTTAIIAMTGLGAAFPWLRVRGLAEARARAISRALPGAIDLCALCMNAGLDFRSAVDNLVKQAHDPETPLIQELRHLLRALDLGSTRAQALRDFAASAPIPSVRELVSAIVQGEQKGTALSEVLGVQAELLRRQRSVSAEEAAAKAGVMLVLPLLLLMGCIMLIMFAPFMVKGFGL